MSKDDVEQNGYRKGRRQGQRKQCFLQIAFPLTETVINQSSNLSLVSKILDPELYNKQHIKIKE